MTKTIFVLMGITILAAGIFAFTLAGEAKAGSDTLLEGQLVGNALPTPPLMVVNTVTASGITWAVTGESEVSYESNGDLEVELEGFIVTVGPFAGGVPPGMTVTASLTCEGLGLVGTTVGLAAVSSSGDVEIEGNIPVPGPGTCMGPAIIVEPCPAGVCTGAFDWIAASGI